MRDLANDNDPRGFRPLGETQPIYDVHGCVLSAICYRADTGGGSPVIELDIEADRLRAFTLLPEEWARFRDQVDAMLRLCR